MFKLAFSIARLPAARGGCTSASDRKNFLVPSHVTVWLDADWRWPGTAALLRRTNERARSSNRHHVAVVEPGQAVFSGLHRRPHVQQRPGGGQQEPHGLLRHRRGRTAARQGNLRGEGTRRTPGVGRFFLLKINKYINKKKNENENELNSCGPGCVSLRGSRRRHN